MMPRAQLKSAVERGLLRSGFSALSKRRVAGSTLVLAYHDIVPHGAPIGGDRSLHLPQAAFAEQLDVLAEACDVVSLETALGSAPVSGRPRAVITFDDAYRGAVTAGTAELAARGLPATVFVAPSFIGGATFWWDVLADPERGGLDAAFRERALHELRGRDAEIREWALASGHRPHAGPAFMACATEAELADAARSPGITFGSHTWSHPNLARATGAELHAELGEPLGWLRGRFGNVVPYVSYPYGAWSPAVERVAAALGYRAGFRIEGGWMPRATSNQFALPRLDVPSGISIDGFALRVAGLFCR